MDSKTHQSENLEKITRKAIHSLYIAYDNLNSFEVTKRKEDTNRFNKSYDKRNVPLQYIQVDSEVSRIRTIAKELELELVKNESEIKPETVRKLYTQFITSPYHINYSVSARIHRLRVKDRLNREAYDIMKREAFNALGSNSVFCFPYSCKNRAPYSLHNNNLYSQILLILTNNQWSNSHTKTIFENQIVGLNRQKYPFVTVLEMLIADSVFCLDEILRLIKTTGDSYIFNHSFFAAVYDRLATWTSRYEVLQNIKNYCFETEINKELLPEKFQEAINIIDPKEESYRERFDNIFKNNQIDNYLQKFLGNDFKEHLSSHYYREQALAHFYQTLDTHNGGRAYLNLLEQMYFVKGDYDDVSSHFNVALERFLINNGDICKQGIKRLREEAKNSELYDVNNYFENEN
jgi:hypothetical protein